MSDNVDRYRSRPVYNGAVIAQNSGVQGLGGRIVLAGSSHCVEQLLVSSAKPVHHSCSQPTPLPGLAAQYVL